ncbi:hypothetical protein RB600_005651, partial [Gaeumannomyces tritici]
GLKLGREARANNLGPSTATSDTFERGPKLRNATTHSQHHHPTYVRLVWQRNRGGDFLISRPLHDQPSRFPANPQKKKNSKKLEPSAMADFLNKAGAWIMANPKTSVAVGSGLTVVAAPVVVMAPVVGPILGAVGFGSSGIIAGSFAATAQAAVGNVVGGSLLAGLTSAGMGGYGAAAMSGAVQAAGGATAAGAAIKKGAEWLWSK